MSCFKLQLLLVPSLTLAQPKRIACDQYMTSQILFWVESGGPEGVHSGQILHFIGQTWSRDSEHSYHLSVVDGSQLVGSMRMRGPTTAYSQRAEHCMAHRFEAIGSSLHLTPYIDQRRELLL